jgi:hypothetical protein
LVKPENPTEEGLLAFLMTGYIRDLKRDGRLPYELPERFGVRHQAEGSFILSGYYDESKFYEPPQPILIIGVQVRQGKFNLIHAPIQARGRGQQQTAPQMEAASNAGQITERSEGGGRADTVSAADEHTAT